MIFARDSSTVWKSSSTKIKERNGQGLVNSLFLLQLELTLWQTMLIDPGQFRVISELLNKTVKGKGRVETLTFNTSATSGS
jgi:hypothetical protein